MIIVIIQISFELIFSKETIIFKIFSSVFIGKPQSHPIRTRSRLSSCPLKFHLWLNRKQRLRRRQRIYWAKNQNRRRPRWLSLIRSCNHSCAAVTPDDDDDRRDHFSVSRVPVALVSKTRTPVLVSSRFCFDDDHHRESIVWSSFSWFVENCRKSFSRAPCSTFLASNFFQSRVESRFVSARVSFSSVEKFFMPKFRWRDFAVTFGVCFRFADFGRRYYSMGCFCLWWGKGGERKIEVQRKE